MMASMPVAGSYSNGERWVSPSDVIKMMPKVSLSKDQVLRVYFYEQGGQRELVLTIDAADINRAKTTL